MCFAGRYRRIVLVLFAHEILNDRMAKAKSLPVLLNRILTKTKRTPGHKSEGRVMVRSNILLYMKSSLPNGSVLITCLLSWLKKNTFCRVLPFRFPGSLLLRIREVCNHTPLLCVCQLGRSMSAHWFDMSYRISERKKKSQPTETTSLYCRLAILRMFALERC